MRTELKFDTVWHVIVSVVLIALGLFAGCLRFAQLGRGIRSIVQPGPQDAAPAPLTPGRRVARIVFGVLAVCCLAAAVFMVWGGGVILFGRQSQAAAVVPFIAAFLFVVLAKACQRMGRESFRW
jgi:hypothetical protein